MRMTINNKTYAPAYMGAKKVNEIFAHKHGNVAINNIPTAFTADELGWDWWPYSASAGRNIARKKKWALIRQAVASELMATDYPARKLMAGIKVGAARRILAKCGSVPYPNEDGSLYQHDANKWMLVSKDCKAVQSLIALGYARAVPEGTFFGNQPKEYKNILVQIDEMAIKKSVLRDAHNQTINLKTD